MKRPRASRGYVLFEDADRVAIVTLRSQNAKTGDMAQVWVLARNESPLAAAKSGADALVCGDCVHRPKNLGTCYVNLFRAPLSVWRHYRAGLYRPLDEEGLRSLRGRGIRLGAYGDPAFVPAFVWARLASVAGDMTGYTHQWRELAARNASDPYRRFLMASVDTLSEHAEARALGWRTFRVLGPSEPLREREIHCPASEEAGYVRTCATCGACDGSKGLADTRASVAIVVHGTQARKFLPVLS